jgi:hypothetical protein
MPVQRQATYRIAKSTDALVLRVDGHKIAVRHSVIGGLNEKQIKTLTGSQPPTWPEYDE